MRKKPEKIHFKWFCMQINRWVKGNKPLQAAAMSADHVSGWEIVWKMNTWLRSKAWRANVKFWGQSLGQGHQPTYQKGFVSFLTEIIRGQNPYWCRWGYCVTSIMRFPQYVKYPIKSQKNWLNCWIPYHFWPLLLAFSGVLWRTTWNTIDIIVIQWHANKWQGILQLLRKINGRVIMFIKWLVSLLTLHVSYKDPSMEEWFNLHVFNVSLTFFPLLTV